MNITAHAARLFPCPTQTALVCLVKDAEKKVQNVRPRSGSEIMQDNGSMKRSSPSSESCTMHQKETPEQRMCSEVNSVSHYGLFSSASFPVEQNGVEKIDIIKRNGSWHCCRAANVATSVSHQEIASHCKLDA